MTSKYVELFKHSARMWHTDDRQTDHATKKCKGISGISCAVALRLVRVSIVTMREHQELCLLTFSKEKHFLPILVKLWAMQNT